jgi:hypothetical protein
LASFIAPPAPAPAPEPAPAPAPEPAPEPEIPPRRPTPIPGPPVGPFTNTRFQFTTGVPANEPVSVADDAGHILLQYRSFASVTSVVAAVMAAIVIVSGLAAAIFLYTEDRIVPAGIALLLAAAFSVMIAMLVPPVNATLYDGAQPAITLAQQSSISIPVVTFLVTTSDGKPLARLRKNVFSRLGRNRWRILPPTDEHPLGDAVEESLSRAIVRKMFGKFSPKYQSNVVIRYLDQTAATIVRRPDALGQHDVLDIDPESTLDRRVAIAIATLILGSEP